MTLEDLVPAFVIPGQTWPGELLWLAQAFADSKAHAEIGVFCGRSLWASCLGMQGARVWAVDDFQPMPGFRAPGPRWVEEVLASTLAAIPSSSATIALRRQHSIEAARDLHRAGVVLDSLFIDGDHSAEGLRMDLESYLPLIRPGGLVAGHDYYARFPGVMDTVQELLPGFEVAPKTRIWWARV